MKELITIVYKPIKNTQLVNKKIFNAEFEELIGMILITSQTISPNNISIQRQNGDIVDVTNVRDLTRSLYNYDYECLLGDLYVKFETLEFIRGVLLICSLFGLNASGLITQIFYKNKEFLLNFDRYIGKIPFIYPEKKQIISLRNQEEVYLENEQLPIYMLKERIKDQYVSLIKILNECFNHGEYTTMLIPSILYVIANDSKYKNIISTICITTNFSFLPRKYHDLNKNEPYAKYYYILNVCSGIMHRNKGITKSLLIGSINELIKEGAKSFLLEVDPNNKNAYELYSKLGFIKIDETFDIIPYHLLNLKVD